MVCAQASVDVCAIYKHPNAILLSEKQEVTNYTLVFHILCTMVFLCIACSLTTCYIHQLFGFFPV